MDSPNSTKPSSHPIAFLSHWEKKKSIEDYLRIHLPSISISHYSTSQIKKKKKKEEKKLLLVFCFVFFIIKTQPRAIPLNCCCCCCAQLVVVVVAEAVAKSGNNNWHYCCCMSVEYYSGIYYAEFANPLQWPQLRKKRRHVAPLKITTRSQQHHLLLQRHPNNNHNNNNDPLLPPSFPPSILLPKPLLPKVSFFFNISFFFISENQIPCLRFPITHIFYSTNSATPFLLLFDLIVFLGC